MDGIEEINEPTVEPVIEPVVEEPVTEPVAEPVVVEPVVPTPVQEFVYEYQPTDNLGRPLGAKQVFKGTDAQQVLEKVAKAHQEAIKLNRELKKNLRLGGTVQDDIPESAVRFGETVEFTTRPFSEEERVQISRDLLDPDKFEEASDRLLEARLGQKPEMLTRTLTSLQESNQRLSAKVEADAFVASHPEYYKCHENFETMVNWMLKNNLAPVYDNYEYTFKTLSNEGLLLDRPIVEPTPQPEPTPVVEVPVVEEDLHHVPVVDVVETPQPQKPVAPKVPSGLTRNQAANAGVPLTAADMITYEYQPRNGKGEPVGQKIVFKGSEAIERMPSELYKRRFLGEKGFAEKVEKLEQAEAKKRR